MKRMILLIVLLSLAAAIGVVSYRYLVIRTSNGVYFMEKGTGTFDQVYLDTTDWSPADYLRHPKISAFLASKGIKHTGRRWKRALKKGMKKAEETVEAGVDTVKEKLHKDE